MALLYRYYSSWAKAGFFTIIIILMARYSLFKQVLFVLFVAVAIVGFFQREALAGLLFRLTNSEPVQGVFDLVNNESFLPAPLRFGGASGGTLTRSGVIKATNGQRVKYGLLPLHENAKLNQDAELKVKDMFEKQYFEHESPTGRGPSDLAEQVGYKYLVVGENLAEGHFKDDEDLVQAWMNSPGHRANILHEQFQEIGVAVGQGQFEGKTVWMAVQSFGTPASVCPGPSAGSQSQIEANKKQIDLLKQEADAAGGNREKYNAIVRQLNQLIEQTQDLVRQYNASVDSYNKCLGEKS
jgi:uncharacterized protein YkwD